MKKYGKYEKRPEVVPAKQPKAKSPLLQTYLTSLLCMVLSVTMFFGTSFAWFTSEVNNVGNEIYIGTLDVELEKQVGEKWESLSDLNDGVNTTKLFDGQIRWEPGYTMLETVQVINEGDLAFNYELSFTDGELAEGSTESIEKVAESFEVWVYYHKDANDIPAPTNYADITAEGSGWVNAGTLAEVLNGKDVFAGKMEEADIFDNVTGTVKKTAHTYTIALHMREEATGEGLMGQKISLNVKLIAYQLTAERDAFGDTYDTFTTVSDAGELTDALNPGGNVLLISDVEIEDAAARVTMNGGTLDGNGNTIRYTVNKSENDPSLGVVTTTGGTVRNLTIEGGTAGRALYITDLRSDLVVSDSVLSGVYSFNLNSSTITEHSLYFTSTIFKNWTSYANVIKHAYFTDCTFEKTLRPYGGTTLTDCTFTTESLDVSALAEGATVTLVNCTYNDITIEEAVLTATADKDGKITVECDNALLKVNGAGVVVLSSTGS